MDSIKEFSGVYRFLSNFHEAPVTVFGLTFPSTEAAYQSQKEPARAKEFTILTAGLSKKLGRKITLRSDWDEVKDDIMWEVLQAKFDQHEDLRKDLLLTGDAHLEEGNTWGDRYWGTMDGTGKNMLGKLLMHLRQIYQDEAKL
jgi:ribA/ribD-fused uncharacterized protein